MTTNIYQGYSKEQVFQVYTRLIEDAKEYEKITRKKMIMAIVEYYKNIDKERLYLLISEAERKCLLKVLKEPIAISHALENRDMEKLADKFLLCYQDGKVFVPKEFKDSLNKILRQSIPKNFKKINLMNQFVIGILRVHAFLLDIEVMERLVICMEAYGYDIDYEEIGAYFEDSMYLCFEIDYIYPPEIEEVIFGYVEYRNQMDVIGDNIKKYETPATFCEPQTYLDFGQYGYLQSKEMTAFCKRVNRYVEKKYVNLIKDSFMEAVAYLDDVYDSSNWVEYYINDENKAKDVLQIIQNAYDTMPSPSLGGLSLKEYANGVVKDNSKTASARISDSDCDLYFKVYFALLEYTNKKYHIDSSIKKIYQQQHLPLEKIIHIRNYIFEHKQVIDEFIHDNSYNFNEEELMLVEDFKYGICGDGVIVEYQKDYAVFLYEEKTYAVKGLRSSIQEILPNVPIMVRMGILPFKNQIVYDGLVESMPIQIGSNMRKIIIKEAKNSPLKTSFADVMN